MSSPKVHAAGESQEVVATSPGFRSTPHLVVAVTSPGSLGLLRGQLRYFRAMGYRVTLICSPGKKARNFAVSEGCHLIEIPMARPLAPLSDLRSTIRLVRALRVLHPDLVNASTPKAGLLVTLAAAITGVSGRVFTLRGLRSETLSGSSRTMVRLSERLTCALAHRVVCISPSLRNRGLELGVLRTGQAVVLGEGSSNGIDASFFSPSSDLHEKAQALRDQLAGSAPARFIGSVGRLARDKGLDTLATAFLELSKQYPDLHLLVVGGIDPADPPAPKTLERLRAHPSVHLLGHLDDLRAAYLAMDVLAHPSLREGFGNVICEAGAMERPVVASDIPGCQDAIVRDETGLLVPPRAPRALAAALARYLDDPKLRDQHGRAARARIVRAFAPEVIWNALHEQYVDLLGD